MYDNDDDDDDDDITAISRVHPVHVLNADSVPGDCQPSDQANHIGL